MQKSVNFRRKRSSLPDTFSTKKASSVTRRKQSQFRIWTHRRTWRPQVSRNGEPVRKVCSPPGRKNQTNQGFSEHEERIPLRTDPARRLREVKKGTNLNPSPCTLWSCQKTILSADAPAYGLGAVLLQEQENGARKPVAYASRSMTSTEQRYARI